MSLPFLTLIGAIPLVGSVVVVALPRGRDEAGKVVALVASLLSLVLAVTMALQFSPGGPRFQFGEQHAWIPQFGVTYALGVDGIGLVLVVLTAVLTPLAILGAWRESRTYAGAGGRDGAGDKGYFALILALETGIVGVFAATDVFVFYVLFEAMLIPMYFMIGRYGGPERGRAAVKFLLYSLLGGLLMLASVIGLYVAAHAQGQNTFLFSQLAALNLDPGTQKLLFLGFFLAFAIKAPLFPFHTWLPDAAAEARPTSAVLLVGLMDKAGTFGMIRYCLGLFPDAARFYTPVVLILAVIGVLYGALAAIGQRDMVRLIAYTSVSHFGLIVLGVFAFTTQAQVGATYYMVSHGLSTGALFLLAGVLVARRGSREIADFGGVFKVAPVLGGTFLVACLSGLALPGLASFVSEFLVLLGTFNRHVVFGVLATLGIVLAALYMLWMYQRTMTGPVKPGVEKVTDLGGRERWAVAPLLALLLVLGVFPQPVLQAITPAVQQTLTRVHVQDPAPTAAAEGK